MGNYLSKKSSNAYTIKNPRKRHHPSDTDHSSPLKKRLHSTYDYVYKELYIKGEGTDITVIALKKLWRLHKLYIKQSPFFCAMLDGNWKESESNRIELEITDLNVTQESLNNIFGSFYCDYITINDESVISTVAAATWFHMEDIRILCTEFMYNKVNQENVCEYYEIAEEYNLPDLINICVIWLAKNILVLDDNEASFDLLKKIPIILMKHVIQCPVMIVIQMEQDVFLLLLKWLYLKLNPETEYTTKRRLVKDSYKYFTVEKSSSGVPYIPVFGSVRWEHVMTLYKTTDRMLKNEVIPKDWLAQAFCRQWIRLLFIYESQTGGSRTASSSSQSTTNDSSRTFPSSVLESSFLDSSRLALDSNSNQGGYVSNCSVPGPAPNLPHEHFWRYSERCGRVMQNGDNTCSWRWTGFHFGLDVIIKYRRRAFTVVRFWDQNLVDGAVSHTETHNLQIAITVMSRVPRSDLHNNNSESQSTATSQTSFEDVHSNLDTELMNKRNRRRRASAIFSRNSSLRNESLSRYQTVSTNGILHLSLKQNVHHEILRLPNDFQFPAIVSANILRYEPVDLLSSSSSFLPLELHRVLLPTTEEDEDLLSQHDEENDSSIESQQLENN